MHWRHRHNTSQRKEQLQTIHHSARNSCADCTDNTSQHKEQLCWWYSHKQYITAQGTAVLMVQTIHHSTRNSCADGTNNTSQHKELLCWWYKQYITARRWVVLTEQTHSVRKSHADNTNNTSQHKEVMLMTQTIHPSTKEVMLMTQTIHPSTRKLCWWHKQYIPAQGSRADDTNNTSQQKEVMLMTQTIHPSTRKGAGDSRYRSKSKANAK